MSDVRFPMSNEDLADAVADWFVRTGKSRGLGKRQLSLEYTLNPDGSLSLTVVFRKEP